MAPSSLVPEGIWRPLNASRNEIRLLHIQPAEHLKARVVCSLSAHSIDEIEDPNEEESYKDDLKPEIDPDAPLRFTAISYACGDVRDTVDITIDGRPYPALATLAGAIQHMRHERYEQIMWADQLCINQFDPEERAQQILLMKCIYAKASTLRVWLGLPEDYEYAKKFLTIVALEPSEGLDPRIFDPRDSSDSDSSFDFDLEAEHGFLPGTLFDLKGNCIWDLTRKDEDIERLLRAMEHFISRPWFERVWTIQEYGLAAERTCFHYGTIRTRLWLLHKMMMCIGSFVLYALYQPNMKRLEVERSGNLISMAETAFSYIGRPFGNSASHAMGIFGEKIGAAGIGSYQRYQRKTKPDILERRRELFGDRVDDLKLKCTRIQAIHLMTVLEMGDGTESAKFHSLVLATRSRLATDPRDKVYGLLGLCHGSFVQDMIVDYRIGFEEVYKRWATLAIQELQTPFLLKSAQPHQSSIHLPSWVPDLSLPLPGETLTLLTSIERYYNAWRKGKKFPLELYNDLVLRCTSLAVDVIHHVIDLPNGHPRELAYVYAYTEVARIYGLEVVVPDTSPDYIVEGTVYQALLQALNAGVIGNIAAEIITGFSHARRKLDNKMDALPTIFSMNTTSTRLFLTKKGYIGISFAPDIKRGDELVLLCDSKLPLVLRKASVSSAAGVKGAHEDNVYQLVASTFVTGLMRGEMFKLNPQLPDEGKLSRLRKKLFEEDSDLGNYTGTESDSESEHEQNPDLMGHEEPEEHIPPRTEGESRRSRWLGKIAFRKDKKKKKKKGKETTQYVDVVVRTEPEPQPEHDYKEIFIV